MLFGPMSIGRQSIAASGRYRGLVRTYGRDAPQAGDVLQDDSLYSVRRILGLKVHAHRLRSKKMFGTDVAQGAATQPTSFH